MHIQKEIIKEPMIIGMLISNLMIKNASNDINNKWLKREKEVKPKIFLIF